MIPVFFPAQDTVLQNPQTVDTAVQVVEQPQQQAPVNTSQPVTTAIVRQATLLKKPEEKEKQTEQPLNQPRSIPEQWNTSTDFFIENGLTGKVSRFNKSESVPLYTSTERPPEINPQARNTVNYDWLLGVFLFLVVLFVWIRIFYSKFFTTLANALVSYHLSFKLFEERNVLLHRVSIVLDFIYVLIFSVFIFELIEYTAGSGIGMHGITLFLLLLNIITIYALVRVVILRMTGSLFQVRPLFSEYIHNTFVVNKGLGIALFPVVVMGQYLPYKLVPIVLTLGIAIFIAAFFLKSMRSYQIILRRDVLLFYLILYLCTLEILPLLLGYKFVTALIQSN
jgi:hypothetical protein